MATRKKGKIRARDHADVLEDGASIISIVKDLAEQVDTAYELKEDLQADLDAARKKLSKESAARLELETRVRSLEAEVALAEQSEPPAKSLQAQTALAEQLRQDLAFAEEERNRFADLLTEIQPRLEAATQGRDSLARKAAKAQARVQRLKAEKTALEADLAEGNKAVGRLSQEVEKLREKLMLAEDRSADLRARREQPRAANTDLDAGGRFESDVKRPEPQRRGRKRKE